MSRWLIHLSPLAAALLGLACSNGGGDADTGTSAPDAGPIQLPVCTEKGELYHVDVSTARPIKLAPGGDLPIILGFQGFVFAQVSLRSPEQPSQAKPFRSHISIEALDIDRSSSHPNIASTPATDGPGWQSDALLFFFNDVPMADLVGRRAKLTVHATLERCVLPAEVEVTMVEGGRQEADAGVDDAGP